MTAWDQYTQDVTDGTIVASKWVRLACQRHIDDLVEGHIPARAYAEQWDMQGLSDEMKDIFNLDLPLSDWAGEEGIA